MEKYGREQIKEIFESLVIDGGKKERKFQGFIWVTILERSMKMIIVNFATI